jgi:23S rRNA pseudouridine1911/1915/1917 synthase
MPTPPNSETTIIRVAEPAIRLDKYLIEKYPELTRSYLQKLISQGHISVNELPTRASQKLNPGDTIKISFPPPEPTSIIAESIPLNVIYEDADIAVIDKPAGLTVHPAPGHKAHTLVNALLAHCPELANFDDSTRPGIIHRLDKDTSGLMIIVKNLGARQNLINQFKSRSVSKGYIALVKGKLTPTQGIIEAPIGRDPSNRKRMAVVSGGKYAKTNYKVKEYLNNYTLLGIAIETGRTHQIRVHLSAIGYPVVGDTVYGVKSKYLSRQFIHAYRLGFRLPRNGESCEFTSKLPPDLTNALTLIK